MPKPPAITPQAELPTLDIAALDHVKGGASGGSDMMPMMMMMMMMRGGSGPAPVAAAPVQPQFTFNGQAQGATVGADGSWNYTSNGDEY